MRTVVQRVGRAQVRVDGEVVGSIGRGLLLLVGVAKGDTEADADATARKVAALRCFPGRTPMDLTLGQVGGACLVVSQFTLLADLVHGNRPGFDGAELPAQAEALYLRVAAQLTATGLAVASGRFGARMEVELVNEGPVTFVLDVRAGKVAS
jgi:D-tyrosyl-tRNA(Tyr) deacylase